MMGAGSWAGEGSVMTYISEAEWERRVRRGLREERILTWGGGVIVAICFTLIVAL